uniref:Uncharacterized protein n=1 Tax=Tanacetum cinerariifolium TaxID=118510 RepID=A0A699QQL1_TANCI|nr:hypothetical protein [Tanacetum cinerariifolium]
MGPVVVGPLVERWMREEFVAGSKVVGFVVGPNWMSMCNTTIRKLKFIKGNMTGKYNFIGGKGQGIYTPDDTRDTLKRYKEWPEVQAYVLNKGVDNKDNQKCIGENNQMREECLVNTQPYVEPRPKMMEECGLEKEGRE